MNNAKKFDETFLKYWGLSGAKACKSCRSRQELSKLIPTSIYLQQSASIQPRTSLSKFGGKLNSSFIRLLTPEDNPVGSHKRMIPSVSEQSAFSGYGMLRFILNISYSVANFSARAFEWLDFRHCKTHQSENSVQLRMCVHLHYHHDHDHRDC